MTHLTPEQINAWPPESGADRERALAHLARCEACGVRLADRLDAAHGEQTPASDFIDALKRRGHAAYGPAGRAAPGRMGRWWLGAGALGAAAMLAFMVWPGDQALEPPPTGAVRGASIQALSPAGPVRGALVFDWASPVEASAFDLVVRDEAGAVLWNARVSSPGVAAPDALYSLLEAGTAYFWQVVAVGEEGERGPESMPQRFTIARPGLIRG